MISFGDDSTAFTEMHLNGYGALDGNSVANAHRGVRMIGPITYCGVSDITVKNTLGTAAVKITGSTSVAAGGDGAQWVYIKNVRMLNVFEGPEMVGCRHFQINDNLVDTASGVSGQDGLEISGCSYGTINNNVVNHSAGQGSGLNTFGLCEHVSIIGNSFDSDVAGANAGIELAPDVRAHNNMTVMGNTIRGNYNLGIKINPLEATDSFGTSDVDTTDDEITLTAHGLLDGQTVRS